MTIFLFVLKTIGYILLGILIFLLAACCYLLFLPFHYQFYMEKQLDEKLSFQVKISGFLHFWQFCIDQGTENIIFKGYAFWGLLKIYPWNKNKKEKPIKDTLDTEETLETFSDDIVDEQIHHTSESAASRETKQATSVEKQKASKKKKSKNKKNKNINKREFHKNWKDEHTKAAVQFIIQKVLWLLKKTKPRVLESDISFSLEDPALTGYATGILSLCPGAYGKKVGIYPDFQSDCIYFLGFLKIKGIVFLGHIVYLIGSIYFNKDCKTMFK